jgi:hypothetical protein
LSEAAQRELAAALPSPVPLSVILGHVQEHESTYFVATVKNGTDEQVLNWAVQLEIPPPLVRGIENAAYVEDESDKKRSVFRTKASTVEKYPLWHGASYPFKVGYQISESSAGMRTFNVRATAYVSGRLVAEQIKGVDELSTFFLPAVIARREAFASLGKQVNTLLGDEAARLLRKR